jgi:hypothetical protein
MLRPMRATLLALGLVALACRHESPPPAAAKSAAAAAPVSPPETAEACKACRGDWGVHGLADKPSCNCRTTDAGKKCRDGSECQGMCITGNDQPEHEQVEAGPPARGFFIGRCSELVTVHGCNRIIDRGARARGPVPLAEPPQMICVD